MLLPLIFNVIFNTIFTVYELIGSIKSYSLSKVWIVLCICTLMIFVTSIQYVNAQSSNFMLYDSKYGFSIKYPSDWQKQEQLSNDNTFPKVFDIVTFQSPSKLTQYGIMTINDDTYKGLSDQDFLNKMTKDFGGALCVSAINSGAKCTSQNLQKTTFTHPNGYSGYMTVNTLTISTDKGTSQPVMGIGMYPDGDKIWILVVLSFSNEDTTSLQDKLTTMANSFTIKNYQGITVSQSSTSTQSSFGTFTINSSVFYASKYSSDTINVSGNVASFKRGTPITLEIVGPDGTKETQGAFVKKDGTYSSIIPINSNWKQGNYSITAIYGNDKIGTVYFQVMLATKPAPQNQVQTQNTIPKSYTNSQYGFSIQYPTILNVKEINDDSTPFANGKNIVSFNTASENTGVNIEFVKNDSVFTGLSGNAFLEKMKSFYQTNFCKSFIENNNTCSLQVISSGEQFTSKNGYVGYRAAYVFTVTNAEDGSQFGIMLAPLIIPTGNDLWILHAGSISSDEITSLGKEMDKMLDTFTISNYSGPNKVFNSKAVQKDDTVYLVILNPSTSTNGVYSVKISSNSKIINFIKISGWTSKRLDSKSVIYQTTSSPINPADIFKVKLKTDGKNPEIQWEVFSKDQKSISKGRATP